jgi:hypothetical protein
MTRNVMTHSFSRVPEVDIPRSKFDRSHTVTFDADFDYVYPFLVDEVVPGDSFSLDVNYVARLNTPLYPLMDSIKAKTFYFFCPFRILWDNFVKMMGEQDNPGDSIDYTFPQVVAPVGGFGNNSIYDYMGIEPVAGSISISAMYNRAIQKIRNHWFRDQNLQTSFVEHTGDGPDPYTDYVLFKRAKEHDYFSSCLPWTTKDGVASSIPLGSAAPIIGLGANSQTYTTGPTTVYETFKQASSSYANYLTSTAGSGFSIQEDPSNTGFPLVYADLTNAVAANINDLRQAVQIQRLLERDARSGTRYVESIASHFGIRNAGGDARLQRPEYLGGSMSYIEMQTVPQTGETNTTPQGNLAAYGVIRDTGRDGFVKGFTEHGCVIGLINFSTNIRYQRGIERQYLRKTRYDNYYPVLAHLGEEPVYTQELWGAAPVDEVFGYQERYASYRYKPSRILGKMRTSSSSGLDSWHLAEEFASKPALNSTFIEPATPIARSVAVPAEPDFIVDMYLKYICARPMPVHGVPGGLDHF